MTPIPLGELISPAEVQRAGRRQLPVLSMTMHDGLVDQSTKFKKRVASLDTRDYKVVRRGQLVVGFPIDEGVLAFQRLYDEAIVSPAYGVWNVAPRDLIEPAYLERFLRSPRALSYYKAKLRGSTARRRSLPLDVFRALPVFVPGRESQRAIAEALDGADALRAKRRVALAHVEKLKESLFLHVFGDPSQNPKAWPIQTIGALLESATYGSSERAGSSGEFPMLRMNNVTSAGEMDLTDLKYVDLPSAKRDRFLVRAGDVLFNRTNSPELVGKSAVFHGPEPMVYAGYLIRLRCKATTEPEYLGAFLNTAYAKRMLRSMCKSIIGMANINAREIQAMSIPAPELALQQQFARSIRTIAAMKLKQSQSASELDALFASLQQRAFSGGRRPDAEIVERSDSASARSL